MKQLGEINHAGGLFKTTHSGPNGARADSPKFTTDWATEIHRLWAQGATSTFSLANVVSQARKSFRRGEWTALWESGQMPFAKRKAEMLVAIGKRLGDLNAQTIAHLPRGWSVLYLLAKLERNILLREITTGHIHPKLTFNEAEELVAGLQGKRRQAGARSFNVVQRLERFQEFVQSTLGQWSATERRVACQTLNQIRELIAPDTNRFILRLASVPTIGIAQDDATRQMTAAMGRNQSSPAFPSIS